MATKDTKLEEKDEYVVHGTILADAFKFRTTGDEHYGEVYIRYYEA